MEEGRKGGKKGDFVLGILRWRSSRQREAGPGTGCAVGEGLCSQERARDAGGSRRLGAFSAARGQEEPEPKGHSFKSKERNEFKRQ